MFAGVKRLWTKNEKSSQFILITNENVHREEAAEERGIKLIS